VDDDVRGPPRLKAGARRIRRELLERAVFVIRPRPSQIRSVPLALNTRADAIGRSGRASMLENRLFQRVNGPAGLTPHLILEPVAGAIG